MLFNSFPFILWFLPVTVAGFYLVSRRGILWGACWLVLASLFFYGYWNPRYVPLLLASIAFNFVAGQRLARSEGTRSKALLAAAVCANLLLLTYYKYAGFLAENIRAVSGIDLAVGKIVLPLGISFFTFTQIAYLVDVYRGRAQEASLVHYALFVTYFPHLIAGPILHHAEMMPQFARADVYVPRSERFVTGMAMFTLGLVKKVVLADGIATFAVPAFNAVELGQHLSFVEAWAGAFAYTFQLYFDFSGYCDMAIGLSWMLGIGLPLNFNSPYKAINIVDFWHRWHMTLSRFLRDYLYIPLGGNRRGRVRRYANLMATMAIGGLWHGAGWTFIVWGALHGFYLVVNHAWTRIRSTLAMPNAGRVERFCAWLFTFLAVVVAWVFFRADSLGGAMRMLTAMSGANRLMPTSVNPQLVEAWLWCVALAALALLFPNSQEIMQRHLPELAKPRNARIPSVLVFRLSLAWAAMLAVLLTAGLASLPQPTSFLYFNF